MDKNKVLQVGLRITALRRLRYIDRLTAKDTLTNERLFLKASCEADKNLLLSQRESYKSQLEVTRRELARAGAWYRSWTFGMVVGILVTSAGAVAIGYALRK
jgi:hypothetical protein